MHDVTFLGYPDGRLSRASSCAATSAGRSASSRPQRLVCQSPERMWDRIGASHPDHLAAGEASVCAVYPDARNPFAHPELLEEGLEPHTVAEIWMMAGRERQSRRRHHRHLRPQDRRPAPAPEPGGRGRVARRAHPDLGRRAPGGPPGSAKGIWPSCSRSSPLPDRARGFGPSRVADRRWHGAGSWPSTRRTRAPGFWPDVLAAAGVDAAVGPTRPRRGPPRAVGSRWSGRHGRRHGGARHRRVSRGSRTERRWIAETVATGLPVSSACAWAPSSWPPRWAQR